MASRRASASCSSPALSRACSDWKPGCGPPWDASSACQGGVSRACACFCFSNLRVLARAFFAVMRRGAAFFAAFFATFFFVTFLAVAFFAATFFATVFFATFFVATFFVAAFFVATFFVAFLVAFFGALRPVGMRTLAMLPPSRGITADGQRVSRSTSTPGEYALEKVRVQQPRQERRPDARLHHHGEQHAV